MSSRSLQSQHGRRVICHRKKNPGAPAGLFKCNIFSRTLALAGALVVAASCHADGGPPLLSPLNSGGVFGLEWTPDTNLVYRVQSATDLSNPASWVTEDLVDGSVSALGPVRWMAPETLQTAKYYRIALPDPEILDVQPAFAVAGAPVELYIIGQNFGSNDVLLLDGVVLNNRVVLSPTLITVTLTPGAAGVHSFELDSAATGKKSTYTYSWTIVSLPAGSQRQLEPPTLPPGAPKRLTLKQKVVENPVGEMRDYEQEPTSEVPNLCAFSGELQSGAVDLRIRGRGLDFVWARTYRSSTGAATALGNGWDFSYNISVQPLGGDILIHSGLGRDDRFFAQSNGTYVADGFFSEGTLSNNVFRLTFADSGYWEFLPFDGSGSAGKLARSVDRNGNTMTFGYDGAGRLASIVDDLGRTNNLAYNSSGQLQSITDFSGRTVTYAYYPGGTAGGSAGDLASVTTTPVTNTPNGNDFPSGKTTTFTYTTGFADDRLNHNLASITDANGQTWFQVVYRTNTNPADLDYDAVDYLQRGPYRIKLRRYAQTASPANQYATVKAILNDGVGNVSECFFDSRNRCVRQLDYTGRANPDLATTEVNNRPAGKLRSSDPDYFETRWEWNPDSLCTRVFLPGGERLDAVYERAFNQNSSRSNRRQAGNLRVLQNVACCGGADTDGDGVPDLALRSWYFDYDPRFGAPASECRTRLNELEARLVAVSLLSRKGWDGTVKGRFAAGPRQTTSLSTPDAGNRPSKPRGWDGTVKGVKLADDPGASSARKWEDQLIDFAIRVTDPRRATYNAVYDAHGNCVDMRGADYFADPQNSSRTTVAYNAYGQVLGITNAPDSKGYRRVDIADYYATGPQAGYCATWTVDAQGPTLTRALLEHDLRGNVTRCVDAGGNDTLWTYNDLDQCVRRQSPTNLTARCTTDFYYDANNNLVQATAELRDDTDTKLGTRSDFWSFSALDLCVAQVQQVSQGHFITNRFAYDGNDNLLQVSTPEAVNGNDPTNVIVFAYDERDLLFQVTHAPAAPSSSTSEYAYDAEGRRVTVTVRDSFGNAQSAAVCTYAYDGFGRCVSATDPMGNVSTRAYDANDNLVYERRDGETNDIAGGALNQRLAESRYEYDSLDRCTRAHALFFDPLTQQPVTDGDASTSWSYAPNGALTAFTDDNGHTASYSYDTVGRLEVVTDAKNDTVSYTYDAFGNPLSAVYSERSDFGGAPQLFATYNEYDHLNRCIRAADNAGNTNRYAYDSFGRCVRTLAPAGNLAGRSYDYLGRCTLAIADLDRDGALDFAKDAGRSWTYDDNSRCVAGTDANGHTVSYGYDSLDRCTLITNPDATTCQLVWSPRSNLIAERDGNGTVVSNAFDLLDRCVRRDITPGSGVAPTTTVESFAYDGCSRLVLASNNVSVSSFAYDSLGACVGSTQDGQTTASAYDGVGNRVALVYPGGRLVTCAYDALNQVTAVDSAAGVGLPFGNLAQYAYDGPCRLARVSRANGVNTRVTWDGLAGAANAPGDYGWRQVAGVNHQVAGGGTVIDRRSYSYDRNQNKTLRAQVSPWFQGGPTETNAFGYDSLDRLTLAINSKGSSFHRNDYTLDAQGNRLAVTNDGSAGLYSRDATLPDPADFQMDQYTSTPFGAQQFDANGNLLSRAGTLGLAQYHYDYADRLVEVDGFSGGALGPVATFAYDALGRRVSKTVYPPAPAAPVTTCFLYGSGESDKDCGGTLPLEERLGSPGGPVSRVYCWGHNDERVADLDRDGWPDLVAFNGSGQAQYYQCDELGSVLALTDAKGSVLERYSYDDYGQPSFLSSDGVPLVGSDGLPVTESPQGNPLLFRSMSWDGQTGLYCKEYSPAQDQLRHNPRNRAAAYDPATGRYLLRAGVPLRACGQDDFTFAGDNPWSGTGQGAGIAIDEPGVHRSKIVHRDLAARNVLLAGGSPPKVSDFGMSRFRQEFGPVQGSKRRAGASGDYVPAHRFSLEIDGIVAGGVHSIEGIENETDIVEYKDGEDGTTHARPGNHKPGKMTVTKDWSNTSEWYSWRKAVVDGRVDRKSMSVIFHNDAGEEAGRINFYQCWPRKWVGPSLNARNSGHATEKLEISWETMDFKSK